MTVIKAKPGNLKEEWGIKAWWNLRDSIIMYAVKIAILSIW